MPLYRGTLQHLIEKEASTNNGQMPYFKASEFFLLTTQMLRAVQHLKINQLVHNDLKPDNWLYRRDDKGAVQLVLCDFECCLDVRGAKRINTECKHYLLHYSLSIV
jgi:serine/threonine protein kinase